MNNELIEGISTALVLAVCAIPMFAAMYKDWASTRDKEGIDDKTILSFLKDYWAGKLV